MVLYYSLLFAGSQTKGNFSDGRFSIDQVSADNITQLTISDLRSSDEGEYSCAEFEQGGATEKWDLQVYGKHCPQPNLSLD